MSLVTFYLSANYGCQRHFTLLLLVLANGSQTVDFYFILAVHIQAWELAADFRWKKKSLPQIIKRSVQIRM